MQVVDALSRVAATRPRKLMTMLALALAVPVVSARPAGAADAVAFWNETAITASAVHAGRAAAISPVDLAYVHVAIYDTVVALRGGHKPFAVGLEDVPAGASLDAAIARAAHRVLVTLFPLDQMYLEGGRLGLEALLPTGAVM
jgi:hypothetical protein